MKKNLLTYFLLVMCVMLFGIPGLIKMFSPAESTAQVETIQSVYGVNRDVVSYPAYITGMPKYFTGSIAVIGVEVPDHPDIKSALVDCSPYNTTVGCNILSETWQREHKQAKITASEFQFQAGRATTVWFVWFKKPAELNKGGQ